jgi:hypothetical protein
MDIGPCEGESCPLARTHALNSCRCCESGSCLKSRRITIDHMRRNHDTYIHPFGEGRSRHAGSVTITGGMSSRSEYELAYAAEELDRLTSDWPDDWQMRECEAREQGHSWIYTTNIGHTCRDAAGRGHTHRDGDEPEHIANATQRQCTHCPTRQIKRANGEWSDSRDDCPCCAEFSSEHSQYYCIVCGHDSQ